MKHKTEIVYPDGLAGLAGDLGNLRYDALAEFLSLLAVKLAKDAEADMGRKRPQLARYLRDASDSVDKAWRLCEPFMKDLCKEALTDLIK